MNIIDKNNLDKTKQYWLNNAENLVTSLSRLYGNIKLDIISQKFTNLIPIEVKILDIKQALVRQITLSNLNKTFIFARTIIPKNTYHYFIQEIDDLGIKPIGDNLLFDKSRFKRDKFIIRKLSQKFFHEETGKNQKGEIFSRSSIFKYKMNKKLKFLITEYFIILPEQYYD